jgi:Zn-finger nucleic acid-binding protein
MRTMHVEETAIDRCTSCEGLWFDALEDTDLHAKESIDLLDPPGASPAPGRNEQRRVDCPRCHTQMIRILDRRTRRVWYESCPVCFGKFFDAGELRAIQPRSLRDMFRQWLGRQAH